MEFEECAIMSDFHRCSHIIISLAQYRCLLCMHCATNTVLFVPSYVKLYLLPDHSKDTKRKTLTIRKSVNPEYNETFTVSYSPFSVYLSVILCQQYEGDIDSVEERTLQVTMWSQDRIGHNKFLGEVRLNLKHISLSDTSYQWYSLQDMVR